MQKRTENMDLSLSAEGRSTKKNKRKRTYIILISGIVAVCLAEWFSQPTEEDIRRATVWMECRTTYAFPVSETDTLFCADLSVPLFDISHARQADASYQLRRYTAFFVSYDGCLIAPAKDEVLPPDDSLRSLITGERKRLSRLSDILSRQLQELAYYEQTHSITDDGYTEVMTFYTQLSHKKQCLDSLVGSIGLMERQGIPVPEVRHSYIIRIPNGTEEPCYRQTKPIEGMAVYRLQTRMLPTECNRIRPSLRTLLFRNIPDGLLHLSAFCQYTETTDRNIPEEPAWITLPYENGHFRMDLPPSADGAPVMHKGILTGIYRQDTCIPATTAVTVIRAHRPFWKRWKEELAACRRRFRYKSSKDKQP